jgi:hypothetical protein
MPSPWTARTCLRALAAPTVLAGLLAGLPLTAASASCQAWSGASQPPSPGAFENELDGVTVLSPCNAWAVGVTSDGFTGADIDKTLIEHWDGTSWQQVPSPSPGTDLNVLVSVRGVSASDMWAVGAADSGFRDTLTEHWDGKSWTVVPSPHPGSRDDLLASVRPVSANDVWAVGSWQKLANGGNNTTSQTLTEHWDGASWHQVPSPDPGTNQGLLGVAAAGGNVWAVGSYSVGQEDSASALILRWNGTTWARAAVPSPANVSLTAVGASSADNAWAVGRKSTATGRQTYILHWDGRAWAKVASPNPGGASAFNELTGVTATSASNAWAVGNRGTGTGAEPILLHWDGSRWATVSAPDPAPGDFELNAVAASSATSAWVVGNTANARPQQAFAFHCC